MSPPLETASQDAAASPSSVVSPCSSPLSVRRAATATATGAGSPALTTARAPLSSVASRKAACSRSSAATTTTTTAAAASSSAGATGGSLLSSPARACSVLVAPAVISSTDTRSSAVVNRGSAAPKAYVAGPRKMTGGSTVRRKMLARTSPAAMDNVADKCTAIVVVPETVASRPLAVGAPDQQLAMQQAGSGHSGDCSEIRLSSEQYSAYKERQSSLHTKTTTRRRGSEDFGIQQHRQAPLQQRLQETAAALPLRQAVALHQAVHVTGLPKLLLESPRIFGVVLEQAGLGGESLINVQTQTGHRFGEVLLTFSSQASAFLCVRHFNGCKWEGSVSVTASFVQAPREEYATQAATPAHVASLVGVLDAAIAEHTERVLEALLAPSEFGLGLSIGKKQQKVRLGPPGMETRESAVLAPAANAGQSSSNPSAKAPPVAASPQSSSATPSAASSMRPSLYGSAVAFPQDASAYALGLPKPAAAPSAAVPGMGGQQQQPEASSGSGAPGRKAAVLSGSGESHSQPWRSKRQLGAAAEGVATTSDASTEAETGSTEAEDDQASEDQQAAPLPV